MEREEIKKSAIRILKGSAISLAITLIALFIFASILTYTELEENCITPVAIIITAVSILISSSIMTIKTNKNGIITGGGIRNTIYSNALHYIKHCTAKF